MSKRFGAALSFLLLTLSLLVGLASPLRVDAAENQPRIEVDQEALNQGLETPGVLRVGMEANYAPYNWSQTTDANGAIEISNASGEYANGYDVQIAKQIADALGLKLEIVKMEWDGLPPALQSAKIDAIVAGMSPTPEREKQIDFTDEYYGSDMVVVTLKDGPYANAQSINDFNGAKVTAQLNTFHVDLLDQMQGIDKQTPMDSFPTMISSLLSNKIDAYISDRPGALSAVAANPDLKIVSFEEGKGFDTGDIANWSSVGLRKDSPLMEPINQALATIPDNDRENLMQEMVDLNNRGEDIGFWGEVASIWSTYKGQLLKGAATTMYIALISTLVGFLIGLLIAIYRSMPIAESSGIVSILYKVVEFLITAYIEVFRGTPMMVQAMMIFYGSKLFLGIDMSSMFAALLIVSVNTGAYLAEVIRGGIIGVDDGQSEAAKAIGMNHFQTMTYVVLPQAIRSILPALGNEFVINIKDTSVLNVIAVTELFFVSKSAAGTTYLTFQTFFITAIIYFVLTFTTTRLLRLVERKMSGSDTYTVYQSSTSEVNIHEK
ncbi:MULTISPECIES: ABC transporter permease subunit [Aerococcus]|uniref:ABC transporter permease subunit n=1 Tax=Aerococcus urinae (strain CCUG 59500 / ACS-120-V-Col10a) TaxID=2976812 RepID=UPI000200EF31|nr:ABC transporter permease subunit [Aerococcus sp. Group 1]AEA01476.1 ABC transporter, permease protein [Aerococcus sp. Group 1]MCY3030287.1 ABC transporter permease subunit [Aerococcus sp. Group 1]MCY3054661.1 ABC transporter permease subunit [Aerococcus sp. Group 1]MCY3056391.1 ABC transporter permease subunit [Aerococcus sp. Group 1]MCY3061993.1 ABC transporter permease subunit [Aerococcus sp. Group 1]